MFVSAFKHAVQSLPDSRLDGAFDVFIQHLNEEDGFSGVAMEFFHRVTAYALQKTASPVSIQYDWRFLTTAFVITRFPVEFLGTPEEPYRFSLIDKAWKYLSEVDVVLYACSRAEDDAVDVFLDTDTCEEYLRTLSEFSGSWFALWAVAVGPTGI